MCYNLNMNKEKYAKYIIVNLITFTRIIGSIIMPISYFKHGIGIFAFFVCLIFLTDTIDGKLSRIWKVESFLGAFLDSVGDKLFAFVMIGILSYEYPVMLIVLFLELYIFIIGIIAFNKNKNLQTSQLGKRKTVFLDISISIMYIYLAKNIYSKFLPFKINSFLDISLKPLNYVLIGIMIGLDLIVICDYIKTRNVKVTYERINDRKLKSKKDILFMLTDRDFYMNNKSKKLRELLYE